jgi:pimeloyl-ACP methyl ester carboxylesterase
MTEPTAHRVMGDGVELRLWEWPGDGPPVFFVHATGFHGRCWGQVIARLPGRHAYALDVRGHGQSDNPPPPYTWSAIAADALRVVRELGLRGAVGVGHSMGGHTVASIALAEPDAFAALLLVDPVIHPGRPDTGNPAGGEHFVARRRDRWSSPAEMVERFQERPPFNLWDPAALRDYCQYGLVPAADGDGYVLGCPPAVEAAVYAGAGGSSIWERLGEIGVPVHILRARPRDESAPPMDMSFSPTPPDLVTRFRRAEEVYLPELTHFIPMQAPDLVARHVRDLLTPGTRGANGALE